MRLFLLIVLVIACVEAGKKNRNKNRKNKNENSRAQDSEVEAMAADEVEAMAEDEPVLCNFQKGVMTMNLPVGYIFLSGDDTDECEIGQCLPGGEIEISRIPVNSFGDSTGHELFIYSPSGVFAGKSCKLCTCIDAGQRKYRSCQDFGDSCSNPINGLD